MTCAQLGLKRRCLKLQESSNKGRITLKKCTQVGTLRRFRRITRFHPKANSDLARQMFNAKFASLSEMANLSSEQLVEILAIKQDGHIAYNGYIGDSVFKIKILFKRKNNGKELKIT